ncbi:diguanylate cyclase domain-containing protein [Novosphingobium pokkalii]|uniref:diguanylate cyclase domain-containing protein n=1 Tax=Novosphingobium pokkalii TaxID=1770194 RepID=UPI0036356CE0
MSQTLEKILVAPQVQHRACAVFLLDLDRFKQVNDTLGHPAGDALLKQVAQRLEGVIGNVGRVGRLGGDEFQVIMPGKIERDHLAYLANQVIEQLSAPYAIDGNRVMIGASVGIAIAPDDGVTSEALIRNADLALYAAKDGGAGAIISTPPICTATRRNGASWKKTCAMRSPTVGWSSTTSRWCRQRPSGSPGSRRCCAGTIPSRASSAPTSSFRSPRTPA